MGKTSFLIFSNLMVIVIFSSFMFDLPLVAQEGSGNPCVDCHREQSPGIVSQWESSRHGEVGVDCIFCHQAEKSELDAFEHQGETIAVIVTPGDCAQCHEQEFSQRRSADERTRRHGIEQPEEQAPHDALDEVGARPGGTGDDDVA